MLLYEYKVLFLLLFISVLLQKCYGDEDGEPADRLLVQLSSGQIRPPQHAPNYPINYGHLPGRVPPKMGLLGARPVNSLLGAYFKSEDAKRVIPSRIGLDHYVCMLMDGLLEEWRPFHPHTDAEALQMVRDFLASRNINSDFALLKTEHANHEEWRERLKHLLIHYLKQPFVKQNLGLHRAMQWYLNKLKHTIWVRHRLSRKRISIARMNLVFSYLQNLDHGVDQSKYRFDIYKERNRTVQLKNRLEQLINTPEVKMNSELYAAFKHYIGKLATALEETKRNRAPSQMSRALIKEPELTTTAKPELFSEKPITYVDIVEDFLAEKKHLENAKDILQGKALDTVGGVRAFLEHYSQTKEVLENSTLTEAINTFLGHLKKLPSHHLLDRHLKRETIQKIVTKYERVHEYLSKLEWKRSGDPKEVLQQALESPEVQRNAALVDAIRFYLEHDQGTQEEAKRKRREILPEEKDKPRGNGKEN